MTDPIETAAKDYRARWRALGGDFHGPIVETADIPEANLFKLFAAYDAEIEALRAQVAALTGTLSAISDDSMSRANGDMWLLYYEDADERPVLFQTREALKAAEHRALTQWACHPFAPLTEYEALRAKLADLEARLATAEGEVVRLNQWADGMTDIALKERATGEAYQRELRDKIADLEAKVEKAPCSDFCRDAKEKHHIPYTEHHHACWKVEALGLEGQDYMRRTEAQ